MLRTFIRPTFSAVGAILAFIQLFQRHWLTGCAGLLLAGAVGLGLVWGHEAVRDTPVAELLIGLSMAVGLGGNFQDSPAADGSLTKAESDALEPMVMAMGVCPGISSDILQSGVVACSSQGERDLLELGTAAGKTIYNPSPALSIIDGLNDMRKERPRNACADAVAALHKACPQGVATMDKGSLEKLPAHARQPQ